MQSNTHKHTIFHKQLTSVHDAEHDFKNLSLNSQVMSKINSNFSLVLKFLTGRWLVGRQSVHLVGDRLTGGRRSVGRWSVVGGRLVDGFKETQKNHCSKIVYSMNYPYFASNGLLVRVLDSKSRCSRFKTAVWLRG